MHSLSLIYTLAAGLVGAFVFGFIARKLRLSPIVGYLMAGIMISPNTPGFVADMGIAEQLADLGIILLMFGVGLQFHVKDLIAVQKTAVPGALVQICSATALGATVFHLFGGSWSSGIVFGMCLSVASTVVLLRVLSDNKKQNTPAGHVAIGWLVVEDLVTVLALVLLPVMFGPSQEHIWEALGITILKLGTLVIFTLVVGQKLIPLFLTYVARTGTRDIFTLTVLGVALGIAVISAQFFGASMALGAFLAGMVVGQSEFSARAAAEALPMRDAFAVLFFVSVGMLFNPALVADSWPLILATTGIVLIGKPVAATIVVLLLRRPARLAVLIGCAISQIGEFSFILAGIAMIELKVIPPSAYNAIIAASIISITLNPVLFKRRDLWIALLQKIGIGRKRLSEDESVSDFAPDKERMIIIGYGPLGRTIGRILLSKGVEVVVVEMNIDTVRELKDKEEFAVYGDATQREVLKFAGAEHASSLIISSSGVVSREVVRAAKELNPNIRIVIYATYLREAEALRNSGASVVFSGEREVALSMSDWLLEDIQATDEQVLMERERIRRELL